MMLIKLPGEPARPPLAHSFMTLGAVLAETDVVESASSMGDTAELTLYVGSKSGVLTGGVELVEAGRLLDLALPLLLLLPLALPLGPLLSGASPC